LDKANELGRGGYGSVYLASNLRCKGTKAAVKILSTEGSQALVKGSVESLQIQNELRALMKYNGYCTYISL
jgi:serine/threonine protein kinase